MLEGLTPGRLLVLAMGAAAGSSRRLDTSIESAARVSATRSESCGAVFFFVCCCRSTAIAESMFSVSCFLKIPGSSPPMEDVDVSIRLSAQRKLRGVGVCSEDAFDCHSHCPLRVLPYCSRTLSFYGRNSLYGNLQLPIRQLTASRNNSIRGIFWALHLRDTGMCKFTPLAVKLRLRVR